MPSLQEHGPGPLPNHVISVYSVDSKSLPHGGPIPCRGALASCVAPVEHRSTLVYSALTSGHSSLLGASPEAPVASAASFLQVSAGPFFTLPAEVHLRTSRASGSRPRPSHRPRLPALPAPSGPASWEPGGVGRQALSHCSCGAAVVLTFVML